MYSKSQGISDAKSAISEYDVQIQQLNSQENGIKLSLTTVSKQSEDTRQQLACGLLQHPTQEAVSHVSSEIGAIHIPSKLSALEKDLETNNTRLDALKQHEHFIRNKELVDPIVGVISVSIRKNKDLLTEIKSAILNLESAPHFIWVKQNINNPSGLFNTLKSWFTFSFMYRNKRLAECESSIGNLHEAVNKHDEFKVHETDTLHALDDLEYQHNSIRSHMQQINTLTDYNSNFDTNSLAVLRNIVASHIEYCDLKQIIQTIREDAKILVSKLEALKQKERNLSDMLDHCRNEITDRLNRQNKIRNVLSKWRRSKQYYLSSDKSKWLIETPLGSKKRTTRFCNTYSSNCNSITNYNDYNGYNSAFITGLGFSSLALFTLGSIDDSYASGEIYSEHQELSDYSGEILEGQSLIDITSSDDNFDDFSDEDNNEMVDES